MVVIPLHASGLHVRLIVVLVLPREGDILRPPIERGAGVGSVQVYCVLYYSVVDEADDSFCVPWDDKGWTRDHSIVAYEIGGLQVRVDLAGEGLDFDFEVPDVLACDGVDDFPKG